MSHLSPSQPSVSSSKIFNRPSIYDAAANWCPDNSAQDNSARTIRRGQFGAKYNINFIENPVFIHHYFSSIPLYFGNIFLINLASISAISFINPASDSAVYFHKSRGILSSISLPFQQYFFPHSASISAIFSINFASISAILFFQSRFHFSNIFSSIPLLFQQYFFINF